MHVCMVHVSMMPQILLRTNGPTNKAILGVGFGTLFLRHFWGHFQDIFVTLFLDLFVDKVKEVCDVLALFILNSEFGGGKKCFPPI